MSSTHLSDADIERFHRQQLPANALVSRADHVAGCDQCRQRLAAWTDQTAAAASLEIGLGLDEDGHVSEPDIQAFVTGTLAADRRVEVSEHLTQCRACAENVRDLTAFAGAHPPASRPRARWLYGMLAAAAVLVLGVGASALFLWRPAALPAATGDPSVELLAPADAARVREAFESGRLSLPASLSDLASRRDSLLGTTSAPEFHVTAPVATAVLGTRPTLRWSPLPGSPTYVVTLQEQATGTIASSPPLQRTDWTPDRPLERGRIYTWQVAGSAAGKEIVAPRPPEPAARFLIVDASAAARFERLPSTPTARGVLYAGAGLLDDAEREFAQVDATSADAVRAKSFLAQLRQARLPR